MLLSVLGLGGALVFKAAWQHHASYGLSFAAREGAEVGGGCDEMKGV